MKKNTRNLFKKYIHLVRLFTFLFLVFSYVFLSDLTRDNIILFTLYTFLNSSIIYYIMHGKRKDE